MRTVNFREDVLYAVAYKLGLDPRTDLLTNQVYALVSYINAWVRKLWDAADWPEWTVIEQRTPINHVVSYDEANATPIGKVYRVYLKDPAVTPGAIDTPFRLYSTGVWCGLEHGTNVWIKFGKRAPKFTAVPYDATKAYVTGDLVLDSAAGGGEVYRAVAGSTGVALTDGTKWAKVDFPYQLADPVIRGAYSDALRDGGQTDKAQVEEQGAGAETVLRTNSQIAEDYDPLTDQQRPAPRYRAPGTAGTAAPPR